MKLSKKIITYILVLATVFSVLCVVPLTASAYTQGELITDTKSVEAWDAWMEANIQIMQVELFEMKTAFWNVIDGCFSASGFGLLSAYTELQNAMETWNGRLHRFSVSNVFCITAFCAVTGSLNVPTAYIAFDSEYGVYRLREYHTDLWLVNSSGHFPYYRPPVGEDGNVPAVDTTGIQWLPYKDAFEKQTNRHFVTKDVLDDMADYYNGVVIVSGKYYVITTTDPITGSYLYLCDPHGYPYVNVVDPDSTAVNTPNDYYTDDSQTTTQNGLLIDLIQNVTWFPDGTMQYIDSVIYDESKQSYYVDSHDTYNYINDSYNTTNYHWEYNYYIDYTSITYIGQTEEYEDPYQCYYELPDGRSSADLTKEELEQLALCFVDVINYARSADDTNMRVLYHFDGNLEDSSYWSYCTEFEWVKGASLTYMDEGTFNGSLYLDETAHEFVIHLPSLDMAGDFTFQFRYYQSYTAAPKSDSYISFGATQVMSLPGDGFYSSSGSLIAATPVGSWNEVCFVREGNVMSYFVNGVLYEQVTMSGSLGNYIRFVFGSEQQTYKKLDEMRFTKSAMYVEDGAYTPTAVPYDTNLALVLPDGEVPIADEYFTIKSPEGNLLAKYDFSDTDSLGVRNLTYDGLSNSSAFVSYFNSDLGLETYGLYTFLGTASVVQGGEGTKLSVNDPSVLSATHYLRGSVSSTDSVSYDTPQNCLGLCLSLDGYFANSSYSYNISLPASNADVKTYTLTVIDTDGNVSFVTFYAHKGSVDYFYRTAYQSTTFTFSVPGGFRDPGNSNVGIIGKTSNRLTRVIGTTANSYDGPLFLGIIPVDGSAEIAYMELVESTSPQYEIEWHNAVYSSGQLEDAPVLAVKATTEVTSWQIGGVRPSYPEKGMVWALVENGRITSLQMYTGYAWIAVDGRVWTGQRWIPPASFDVFTLQDFWDMVGTSGDDYTYIYTESGFWDWWQKQWLQFTDKLFNGDGSGSPDDSDNDDSDTNIEIDIDIESDPLLGDEDKEDFDPGDYVGIFRLLKKGYNFISGFFGDFIVDGLGGFIDNLTDFSSPFYDIFRVGGLD